MTAISNGIPEIIPEIITEIITNHCISHKLITQHYPNNTLLAKLDKLHIFIDNNGIVYVYTKLPTYYLRIQKIIFPSNINFVGNFDILYLGECIDELFKGTCVAGKFYNTCGLLTGKYKIITNNKTHTYYYNDGIIFLSR